MYQTDPAGVYTEWKANAIGRNAKTVREFLEKNFPNEGAETEHDTIKLAVKALLEAGGDVNYQWTKNNVTPLMMRTRGIFC